MKYLIQSAKFVGADPEWNGICPEFLKKFVTVGGVKSAKMHISALGVYDVHINGERVSDVYMAPGWTMYEKRLQFQTYDIKNYLTEGENDLIVGAGHGWYSSRIGTPKDSVGHYGLTPAIIFAIEIVYKSGEKQIILSDESLLVRKSKVVFSQIYDGESVDGTLEDSFKEGAQIVDYPYENLIPNEGEAVRVTERVGVKSVIRTPGGECVLDFGQNLTGTVEFTVNAKGGEVMSIDHAEILDKDGNFYTENYRSAKAKFTYVAEEGKHTIRARFTFFGFRYLRLNDWCEEVKKENFTALVMHSDIQRIGYFKTSYDKLNRLYSNVIWGQKGNFLDVPTDCPQRDERLGWTGDAQVFAHTACTNFNSKKFFTKWLRDMAATQRADGAIPFIIPNLWKNEYPSAAWGDAATVIPLELYKSYGDKKLLAEFYPMMKKWVDYIVATPGNKYLWQNGRHFGDWLGLDAPAGSYKGSTSEELIASAYYYLSTCNLIEAGEVLGKNMSRYKKIAQMVKKAYTKAYIKNGRLIYDTQTAHVLTLRFGLAEGDEELKAALSRRLIELIEGFGDRLQTGFVGTPYLLDTLTEIGREDKAYTLLLQEKFPSWLFSVNMGATTIWEHWDGLREDGSVWSKDMNSFNHYAYGAVASWLYGTVCGISQSKGTYGYSLPLIAPIPDKRLGSAKARIDTEQGSIISEWCWTEEGVRYSFTIPTTSIVRIDGKDETLPAGTYTRWGK